MSRTIVMISDTHGLHGSLEIPQGDILVHAGDFSMRGRIEELVAFNEFLGTLPHPTKIVIAGNHDFCFEQDPAKSRKLLTNGTYLQDEEITVEGIRFYGSPWQPWFYDWAFNLQRGAEIKAKWDLIPDNTDILITHGPPLGFGGMTASGQEAGCSDLLAAVKRVKPRLHVFGHIHEAYGTFRDGGTMFVNASTCDLAYEPVNKPVVHVLS